MRALEGSRAAKWTSRKGPPKEEEEEEEEEEVEVKEEEKEEKRSRGEHTTPYSTFYLGHPSPHPPVCRQSSSSLGLLLRGYHSAATRGATLWLPTSELDKVTLKARAFYGRREEDVRLCISVARGVSPFTSSILEYAHLLARGYLLVSENNSL
uniref:Uncharacterized protein n=1 Tax=Vespula pensylvanica TaxID=30213 RepID=A0A834PAE7_VESPE|nr:hypothetical protein H0235_002589 [Vespula pensylvanica]